MTEDHFGAIVAAAEAKKDPEGWWAAAEGRHITLYASFAGSSLSVSRVNALRIDGPLVKARTARGESYILALADLYAGQIEGQTQGVRRAGFG
jgi:hypothetical protein